MEKVINDCEIKELVLNPAYLTDEDFEALKKQGLPVRWVSENEGSDKNIFQLVIDEN